MFSLRVPASSEPARTESPVVERVDARGRRVLVIEDNVDAAESLKAVLELDEHEVEVAFSGPEGIEKARAFAPDVVLCDIGLPGLDGYNVARTFRADGELRELTLVALTGYAMAEDRKKATSAGFDRHVAKPPDLGLLERIIAELPGRRAA
ncbi:MAG: response regulator [Deltaproteobacteria bacterium]|nr:response regulator [Deltaproteobacteria bacterium]